MMSRAPLVPAALLVLTLAAGCGGGGGGSGPTNPGGGGPTFNFTFPSQGTSQVFTFATAGTWNYGCSAHASMNGTVVVDASAPADSAVVNVGNPGGSLTYDPASVSIKPGGYVRWVNASTLSNHTVTRP